MNSCSGSRGGVPPSAGERSSALGAKVGETGKARPMDDVGEGARPVELCVLLLFIGSDDSSPNDPLSPPAA